MPMGVDPMAVDWRPGGRVGGAMSDATTDEEPAHPERGDGGAALAAAGSAAALEAAAMRASDELQRMTIGADSDAGGSERTRRRSRHQASRPGQCRVDGGVVLQHSLLHRARGMHAGAGEGGSGAPEHGVGSNVNQPL